MSSNGKKVIVKKLAKVAKGDVDSAKLEENRIGDRLIEIWCKRNGDNMNSQCFVCNNKLHFRDFYCDYAMKMNLDNLEPLCLSCMKGLKKYNDTQDEEEQSRSDAIERRLLKAAQEADEESETRKKKNKYRSWY